MIDLTMLVLIGAAFSSLFVAFIEYAYSRKKRLQTEVA
jgi:cbb3-type cytochrome oxidase subunit 3